MFYYLCALLYLFTIELFDSVVDDLCHPNYSLFLQCSADQLQCNWCSGEELGSIW